jgi:uncharacterized protein YkwD
MRLTNLPVIGQYLKFTVGVPVLAMAFLFAGTGSAALACPYSGKAPANLTTAQAELSVTCLVNKARQHHNARRLAWKPGLQTAARNHSAAMDSGNFFSHEGDGSPLDRIRATGYLGGASSRMVGETIHRGAGGQGSPKATVKGWMSSSTHRYTMLSRRFRNIGVGVAMGSPMGSDGQNTAIYTADFGLSR